MDVIITFRQHHVPAKDGGMETVQQPDAVIKDAEDIAVNPLGMIVVLGPKKGEGRQVLGAFPGDAVAGVYAPDGVSMIETLR